MLDTPENRCEFAERARAKLRDNWSAAWFALAQNDDRKHFVVIGRLKHSGEQSHLDSSGILCEELGIDGKDFRIAKGELESAGWITHNHDGENPELRIMLPTG